MQNSPNLDKTIPLNSFVLNRSFEVVHFLDKLKPIRNGSFKISNKPTDVTYDFLTEDGKIFHT